MVIDFKASLCWKADFPMAVTVPGILMAVRLSQSQKALSPMAVTVSGMTTAPPAPLYLVSTPFLSMTNSALSSPALACAASRPSGFSSGREMPPSNDSSGRLSSTACPSSDAPPRTMSRSGSISGTSSTDGSSNSSVTAEVSSSGNSRSSTIASIASSATAAEMSAHSSHSAASNRTCQFFFILIRLLCKLVRLDLTVCRTVEHDRRSGDAMIITYVYWKINTNSPHFSALRIYQIKSENRSHFRLRFSLFIR